MLAFLIPDTPGPVRMAIDREGYLRKRALELVRDSNAEANKKVA